MDAARQVSANRDLRIDELMLRSKLFGPPRGTLPGRSRGRYTASDMRVATLAAVLVLATAFPVAAQTAQIVISQPAEATTLDPGRSTQVLTVNYFVNVYDTLTRWDTSLQLQPGLATSWKTVNDTTWEFVLRPGVKFHDGSPFTAEDVKATLERNILDADGSLWRIFHPTGFNGKYWVGSQPGQRFHDLMEQARFTLDPKKRKALYMEATAIFHEEKPSVELFQEVVVYGTSRRVSFKPRADFRLIVSEMTLAR